MNFEPTEDWPTTVIVPKNPMKNKMNIKQALEILKLYAAGNRSEGLSRIADACSLAAEFIESKILENEREIKRLLASVEFHDGSG